MPDIGNILLWTVHTKTSSIGNFEISTIGKFGEKLSNSGNKFLHLESSETPEPFRRIKVQRKVRTVSKEARTKIICLKVPMNLSRGRVNVVADESRGALSRG